MSQGHQQLTWLNKDLLRNFPANGASRGKGLPPAAMTKPAAGSSKARHGAPGGTPSITRSIRSTGSFSFARDSDGSPSTPARDAARAGNAKGSSRSQLKGKPNLEPLSPTASAKKRKRRREIQELSEEEKWYAPF